MRIKFKNNITLHKLENKVSIFDGEKAVLYTLNSSAEFILNGLNMGWGKKKILGGLKDKYGATSVEAEEDYKYVWGFLNEKQIIENK